MLEMFSLSSLDFIFELLLRLGLIVGAGLALLLLCGAALGFVYTLLASRLRQRP